MIAYIKARAKEFFTWFGVVGAGLAPVLQTYAGFNPKIAYAGVALGVVLALVKTP
jgi:hypothetical protein